MHEAFSIDSFQDRLLFSDDFLGAVLRDLWRSTGDAGGSAVVVDAQDGGIVRITTDGDNADDWRLDWTNIRSLHINKKVTMELRIKLAQTTNMALQLYLFFDADNRVGFTTSGANFGVYSEDDNVGVGLDAGIALDTDYHILRIECFPTDAVHFYIDGVETLNSPIIINIPDDAGDYLQPYLWLRTLENATKSMDIDYIAIRQEIYV